MMKICLTKPLIKIVTRGHRDLETRPSGDSPNQIWMISGQWFNRFFRIGQKLHKITHNSM